MTIIQLLILQLIAHIFTDYLFQNHYYAKEKNEIGFKSSFLKWHAVIAFGTSWIVSFQTAFVFAAAFIAVTHYIIDGFKMYLNRNKSLYPYAYFIDQIVHIAIIGFAVALYGTYTEFTAITFLPTFSTKWLLIILAYLTCSKPANIFIKQLFHLFEIKINLEDELPNAGKLIGTLERWLILTFILAHHFEAVGFLIAAKSILRFKNDDTVRSEYVLIGTMLSFGIAIGLGILINKFAVG